MKLIPGSIEYFLSKLENIEESRLNITLNECKCVLAACIAGEVSQNNAAVQQYLKKYATLFGIRNSDLIKPQLKEGEMIIKDIVNQLKEKAKYSKKVIETTTIQLTGDLASGNMRDMGLIDSVVRDLAHDYQLGNDIKKEISEKFKVGDVIDKGYTVDLSIGSSGDIYINIMYDTGKSSISGSRVLGENIISNSEIRKHVILWLLNNAHYESSLRDTFSMIIVNRDRPDIRNSNENTEDDGENEGAFN